MVRFLKNISNFPADTLDGDLARLLNIELAYPGAAGEVRGASADPLVGISPKFYMSDGKTPGNVYLLVNLWRAGIYDYTHNSSQLR
jgi:hypothetical protein